MTRALVLNNGVAWAAYQVGGLRHLVGEQKMRFDLCAGSGMGAINAAFVACNEFEALETFWHRLSWRRLTGFNWKTAWREGPLNLDPLQALLARHISERKLADQGVQLIFNCLDITTGEETTFTYPGSKTPLIDALTAAASLPGLVPPLSKDGDRRPQWVDGTLVNSFIVRTVLQQPVDELWAIAAAVPRPDSAQPGKQYPHWRAISSRALQLNQSQDVWLGLAYAQWFATAVKAHQQLRRHLPEQVTEKIDDPELKAQLKSRLSDLVQQSDFPLQYARSLLIHAITPSQELAYPLWRFRAKDLARAQTLGYADAQAYMHKEMIAR